MILPPRSATRLTVLAVLVGAPVFLPGMALRIVLIALSPFIALSAAIATRAADAALLCGIPMLVLILCRRRWLCRFCCPVGWAVEMCARARPKSRSSYTRMPHLGRWAALMTIVGAALACPLFLAFDPIAMLAGAAGVIARPGTAACAAYAVGFLSLIVISLVFPHLWCTKLCPLGGLQEFLADLAGLASRRKPSGDHPPGAAGAFSRRAFAGLGAGALAGLAVSRLSGADASPVLRPPGTVEGATLQTLCVRCGTCIRSCPTGIIQPDLRLADPASLLTPLVRFEGGYCREDCNRCGAQCPTGAIAHLSLAEKNERAIGVARIDHSECLLRIEKECSACVVVCPRKAIAEVFSQETYTTAVEVDPSKCNGCGACIGVCPVHVITVEPRPALAGEPHGE